MGTIVMQAEKVIAAADFVISTIRETRAAKDELAIGDTIKYSKPTKFQAFFGKKQLDREGAIKYLRGITFGNYPSIYARGDLEKAKKLRKLAEHGDPVTLNEDDIAVLF